jgi:group II intron reverse transcriptase/maturase
VEEKGIAMLLTTPDVIRTLQRKLYTKAKQEPAYRFYALYDKAWRADILMFAYRLVRANKGSPGVDGVNFDDIEQKIGIDTFLSELAQDLKDKTYHPSPVRRVMIPKADGSQRPLGIPTIRDRVAQMAVKLVIEPIFEADFCPNSYGFRPKKSAHDAVDEIADALHKGYTQVIDADLSKYFDSIPHAELLAVVAERIVDSAILHVIKLWLKAPVIGEDKDGTRKNVGGGKANSKGTPQGGVISPLLSNCYLHLLDRIWEKHQLRFLGFCNQGEQELEVGQKLYAYLPGTEISCKNQRAYNAIERTGTHANTAGRYCREYERQPSRVGELLPLSQLQWCAGKGEDARRRTLAHTPDEAAQGQRSWDRPWSLSEPAALHEIWAIQGSDNGGLEISACLGVKNIGKPYAGIGVGRALAKQKLAKPHVRFDEGR